MNNLFPRLVIASVAIMSCNGATVAQDAAQPKLAIEMLQNQLQERDTLLMEMLERIEALESRLRLQPSRRQSKQAQAEMTTTSQKEVKTAPGLIVVDASMAERALERSLSHEGALLLPAGVLEIVPGFILARQENTTATFIENNNGLTIGQNNLNINQAIGDFGMRLGLPKSAQLELGLPFRLIGLQTVTESNFSPVGTNTISAHGFGDLRIGLAKTLMRERPGRPDLIGRITWDSRTGETADNGISLSSGFNEIRGSLTAIKRQDPVVFIGGLTYQHSFSHNMVKPGSLYGVNLGAAYALSPETSLRFAIGTSWQDKTSIAGNRISGSDRLRSSFIFGGSTLLQPGVLMNMSLGIGLTKDADDVSLSLSFPIRFQSPLF